MAVSMPCRMTMTRMARRGGVTSWTSVRLRVSREVSVTINTSNWSSSNARSILYQLVLGPRAVLPDVSLSVYSATTGQPRC